MSKELELYKAFIDGLVERKDSMTALWVKGDGFPKTEDNKAKNELLAALTPEQKGVLAEMLQDEHIAGIHTTLAYINKMMDLDGLELHQNGESYPNDHLRACTMTSSAVVTAMSGRNKRRRPGRGEGGRSDLDQLLYRRDFWTGTPA